MKLNFSFLILLFFLFSCVDKAPEIPAGIIQRDSMIEILADIHIAESRLIQDGYKPNNENFKAEYIQHVLKQNGTDSLRFNKSFLFYSSNPEFFQGMYEEVITEISKKQAEGKGK